MCVVLTECVKVAVLYVRSAVVEIGGGWVDVIREGRLCRRMGRREGGGRWMLVERVVEEVVEQVTVVVDGMGRRD